MTALSENSVCATTFVCVDEPDTRLNVESKKEMVLISRLVDLLQLL